MTKIDTLLRIDSSARKTGSSTRALTDKLIETLSTPNTDVVSRDLTNGIGMYTEAWVEGTFTPEEKRSEAHKAALAESDELVAEVQNADTLVIGAPMYNFNIAASLKAWVDQIARAGVTFRYTEEGPVGLLENIKTYIVFASGGSPVGSELDFGTKYLKHFLAFLGITDVTVIASENDIEQEQVKRIKAA